MKRQKSLLPLLICCAIFLPTCKAPEALRHKAKAQRLLSRIERLDPSALAYSTDTIFKYITIQDTFIYESRQYDTTFIFRPGDTITLTDTVKQITTMVVFREGSASLSLTIPKDTIVIYDTIRVPVAINHSIGVEKKPWYGVLLSLWRTSKWLVILAVVALLALFLLKRV